MFESSLCCIVRPFLRKEGGEIVKASAVETPWLCLLMLYPTAILPNLSKRRNLSVPLPFTDPATFL